MLSKILNSNQSIFLKSKRAAAKKHISDALLEMDIAFVGNPDVFEIDVLKLGVEEARSVRSFADSRPVQMDKKIVVVYFDYITDEAQNSLLKVLEEPESSKFILVSERGDQFIPTLKSRLFFAESEGVDIEESLYVISSKKSIAENLKIVDKIVLDYKDEKITKIEIEKILRRLLKELRTKDKVAVSNVHSQTLQAINYLHDTSSSIKMLLESVVILL